MKCCKFLNEVDPQDMPFQRALVTGYYDGPTEGFTRCDNCDQAYSFRMLDWDSQQDLRIFAFAPLDISLDEIAQRLVPDIRNLEQFMVVPPLSGSLKNLVDQLMARRPTSVAAITGWPGRSALWRDVTQVEIGAISDWFSFLGISRQ